MIHLIKFKSRIKIIKIEFLVQKFKDLKLVKFLNKKQKIKINRI